MLQNIPKRYQRFPKIAGLSMQHGCNMGRDRVMEYPEMQMEAAIARAGADRMAIGLPCIPDKDRGDLAEVQRLRGEVERLRADRDQMFDRGDEIDRLRAENERLQSLNDDWARLVLENERLRALVDSECRRAEDAHGMTLWQSLEIERLRTAMHKASEHLEWGRAEAAHDTIDAALGEQGKE